MRRLVIQRILGQVLLIVTLLLVFVIVTVVTVGIAYVILRAT